MRSPQTTGAATEADADRAGLTYVSDEDPGIRRVMRGKGFAYLDAKGRTVRDPETKARIKRLAIPPAWTDVWICPTPDGHIQATGRDARGRKQYRYHPDFMKARDATKYERMLDFAQALPAIRRRVARDMAAARPAAREGARHGRAPARDDADPRRQRRLRARRTAASA